MSRDISLTKIDGNTWEIEPFGNMNVPGRIYANDRLMEAIQADDSPRQVANVACLPGIVDYSYAMPDIHYGYGFPIGGVAAFDPGDGVISPGGVGYDINCGVRLVGTSLAEEDVAADIEQIMEALFHAVPSGVGSSGAIGKLNREQQYDLLERGAEWAVDQGFGREEDLPYIEDGGRMEGADPGALSDRAIKRGLTQVGTLGSGNHFLEVDVVDQIFDREAANAMGLEIGQVVLQIHSGSRGLGYQVCDDNAKKLIDIAPDYGIHLPDKQLACTPVDSPEGQQYIGAMKAAANYAWVNRHVMMDLAVDALAESSGAGDAMAYNLVYDVCHNIAKFEEHHVKGEDTRKEVVVHRKGATRSLPPGHNLVPEPYQNTGQPVLVPGSMGSSSYVLRGAEGSLSKSFGSCCHGAGRAASRTAMKKKMMDRNLDQIMEERGVYVRSQSKKGMAEEMPSAYKDVSEVVQAVQDANLARKVARVRPIGTTKG